MGRAPCCEKIGLKKGPWSHEEDRILISYIEKYGHANWRALPKQAGLLRCGKSCRLRWMNYLKPDIKRGNFTQEEEEIIIKLHEMLGNRWSTIAARLPGRTDNEIKNVWHTHLKKRLNKNQEASLLDTKKYSASDEKIKKMNSPNSQSIYQELSPQPSSSSEFSSASNVMNMDETMQSSKELLPPIDESFWSDISSISSEYPSINDESSSAFQALENCPTFSGESHQQYSSDFTSVMDGSLPQNSFASNNCKQDSLGSSINTFSIDDDMDFWYELFMNSGGIPELTEF